MHDEALAALPEVLASFAVRAPILIGHSDGASIALIHAGGSGAPVRALILEAPHVFVEDLSVESIARMKMVYETTELSRRLARYHAANTETMFRGWNDVWLRSEFRRWNIEEYLPRVRCPVLVIQGRQDEYGTIKQVEAIAAQAAGPVETVLLENCGHAPHRDQRTATLAEMTRFIRTVTSDERETQG